ncbi:hypothetical protein IHE44_0015049 [Lamprotornis superbus]|uniref:Uncharacterized protein n=1 Tax=Lamprotornis superbus TaxID=245042 RepID=A0A835TVC4_9PASS|nr:hypothetical protein IHE44_0015049 [Lamprotornis superbus]
MQEGESITSVFLIGDNDAGIQGTVEDKVLRERILQFLEEMAVEGCDGIIQDCGWSAEGRDVIDAKEEIKSEDYLIAPVTIWFSHLAECDSPNSGEMKTESTPLRCRKLSNPDIFSSAGKTKLHRQLSQDDCKLRRGSLASSLSGKQLLPLSNSVHSGVGQTIWQPPGDTSNLVRMRNQSLGQSAPSLTAGLLEYEFAW